MGKRWLLLQEAWHDCKSAHVRLDSVQNGLAEAPVNKSRKQIKERKNRTKKIRGVKKNAGAC